MGQADRLRLDPTASQDGRPQGWTPRRGAAPQESNGQPGSGIARNGEAGQGWHRPPAPPERAQDARSRPRPGVGPSDPRKTPLRASYAVGIRRARCAAAELAGRAR